MKTRKVPQGMGEVMMEEYHLKGLMYATQHIVIFDEKTRTLYSLNELLGPSVNGNAWQFIIPEKEESK